MPRLRHPFSWEKANAILSYIEGGGFAHVAAQAAGVPQEVFQRWLERGSGKKAREPYRTFSEKVAKSLALARLDSELDVRKGDPRSWLKCGPGKEAPGNPGWSRATKPLVPLEQRVLDIIASRQVYGLLAKIAQALQPFPEARLAVKAVVEQAAREQAALPPPPGV